MAKHTRRILFLVVAIALVTIGHYATDLEYQLAHDVFRRLYYLPIIIGAYWFGSRGGLVTAAVVSAVFVPHVLMQWQETPLTNAEQYLEMIMYLVVGGVTGALAHRGAQQRDRLRQASAKIEDAYAQLKQQSIALLEAEEQVRRADRLAILGELSAVAAHEIRNPLGSIKGTAEIFRDSLGPDHKLYEFAQILVKEADRLDGILTDFLQVAGAKGSDALGEELAPVVDHVVRLTAERARLGRVAIVTNIPPLPKVAIAAPALHQVLLNLLLNAIQASGPEGRISVAASVGPARRGQRPRSTNADVVHVAVTDNGPGVPRELRSRIFDPFFTTKHEGTGLGLAICQRIMQGFQGAIHVESAVPKGARFTIEIPIAADELDVLAEVGE